MRNRDLNSKPFPLSEEKPDTLKGVYAAAECNVMLPPSVQSIIHAEGVRCRSCVRSERCRVRVRESKVRFADNTTATRDLTFSPSG
jgi:hypothetical protein